MLRVSKTEKTAADDNRSIFGNLPNANLATKDSSSLCAGKIADVVGLMEGCWRAVQQHQLAVLTSWCKQNQTSRHWRTAEAAAAASWRGMDLLTLVQYRTRGCQGSSFPSLCFVLSVSLTSSCEELHILAQTQAALAIWLPSDLMVRFQVSFGRAT